MYKICIDTTVFKNYRDFSDLLIKFLKDVNSLNFAYEGEKNLIDEIFHRFVEFVSEDDLSLDEFLELKDKYPNLHDGEICLIAYALENGCCFLSDDKKARSKAKKENLLPCCLENYEVGGSIGVLLFLRDISNFISRDNAKQIYEKMIAINRLPDIDFDKISLNDCI